MSEAGRSDVPHIASDGAFVDPLSSVAALRAAKADPHYLEEAARQARSAASADIEDRVMEWVDGVAAEAWDDL